MVESISLSALRCKVSSLSSDNLPLVANSSIAVIRWNCAALTSCMSLEIAVSILRNQFQFSVDAVMGPV